LADVREKLAEIGHHYPVTTLSGAMQAQTRSRNLRRFKQGGRGKYVYVQ
jgi:superfamily II DNA/RNA helicase